jgi:hypothetical protein
VYLIIEARKSYPVVSNIGTEERHNAVYPGESQQAFRRNISALFSGLNCKPSTKPGDAGSKPMKVSTANIPVNRIPRRFEGNIGKYAVVGSVTAEGEYREVCCSGERNGSRGI